MGLEYTCIQSGALRLIRTHHYRGTRSFQVRALSQFLIELAKGSKELLEKPEIDSADTFPSTIDTMAHGMTGSMSPGGQLHKKA